MCMWASRGTILLLRLVAFFPFQNLLFKKNIFNDIPKTNSNVCYLQVTRQLETYQKRNETKCCVTKAFSPAQLFHLAEFNQVSEWSAEQLFKAKAGWTAVLLVIKRDNNQLLAKARQGGEKGFEGDGLKHKYSKQKHTHTDTINLHNVRDMCVSSLMSKQRTPSPDVKVRTRWMHCLVSGTF